jgi:PadR family transcriptional regulator, regulatory protein PadR
MEAGMADEAVDVQALARGINEALVLATLRRADKHGYQIAQDVERASGGRFVLQHGTLYPILHRLEKEKLIEGRWVEGEGRRRKQYRLTRSGRRRLEGETDQVRETLSALLGLLAGPEHAPA